MKFRSVKDVNDSSLSFSGKVIEIMRRIPRGRVTTYKEIARVLDCRAYRAVGNAVGRNPHAPAVPCHRVVKANGTVGEYSKGAGRKIELLRKEGIRIDGGSENAKVLDFEKVLHKFKHR